MHQAPHYFPVTVYYEDTDAGGVVYYANYLKFAERARTEWLRSLGVNQSALWENEGLGFVVKRCALELHKPAKLDDHLSIETHLHEVRRASMTMQQKVRRGEVLLAELVVTIACVNAAFKPVRMPEIIT